MRIALWLLCTGLLAFSACATSSTTPRTIFSEPRNGEVWDGRVEWIQETVYKTEGDVAAGAVAGAVVGGVLGGLITGHRSGSALGAATGAIIGASESQGSREERSYDVLVRFANGSSRVFRYWGYPPFRPGQQVSLSASGLVGRNNFAMSPEKVESPETATTPSSPEPEETPPPPPAKVDNPKPAEATQRLPEPAGRWAYTQQYGWVWMPYDGIYTFTPNYETGDPYMYVYYPGVGWTWVEAPWLWGWGPKPYIRVGPGLTFSWYRNDWGRRWKGWRPPRYRYHRKRRPRRR